MSLTETNNYVIAQNVRKRRKGVSTRRAIRGWNQTLNSSVRETDKSRNSHVAIVVVFFTRSGCVGDLTSIMSVAISTYTWTLKPPLRKSESVLMVSCSL